MSTVRDRPRHVCPGCSTPHRSQPTEVLVHIRSTHGSYWAWSARPLCPPCRIAELHHLGLGKIALQVSVG